MNLRWSAAIHESGHAATALALGGQVNGLTVTTAGAGLCRALLRTKSDEPIFTAAGDAATELLGDHIAPELVDQQSPTPEVQYAAAESVEDAACEETLRAFNHAQLLNDDSFLRRAASEQGDPDEWANRYFYFRFAAARIVNEQRAAVVAIASELYRRGQLDGREVTEIFHREKR